jgi:hypothetical protein
MYDDRTSQEACLKFVSHRKHKSPLSVTGTALLHFYYDVRTSQEAQASLLRGQPYFTFFNLYEINTYRYLMDFISINHFDSNTISFIFHVLLPWYHKVQEHIKWVTWQNCQRVIRVCQPSKRTHVRPRGACLTRSKRTHVRPRGACLTRSKRAHIRPRGACLTRSKRAHIRPRGACLTRSKRTHVRPRGACLTRSKRAHIRPLAHA